MGHSFMDDFLRGFVHSANQYNFWFDDGEWPGQQDDLEQTDDFELNGVRMGYNLGDPMQYIDAGLDMNAPLVVTRAEYLTMTEEDLAGLDGMTTFHNVEAMEDMQTGDMFYHTTMPIITLCKKVEVSDVKTTDIAVL